MAADIAVFGHYPGAEYMPPRDIVPLYCRIMSAEGRRACREVVILSSRNIQKQSDMKDLMKALGGNQTAPGTRARKASVKPIEGGFDGASSLQDMIRAETRKLIEEQGRQKAQALPPPSDT